MEMKNSDLLYYQTNKTTKIAWQLYKVIGLVVLRNMRMLIMILLMCFGFFDICNILQC